MTGLRECTKRRLDIWLVCNKHYTHELAIRSFLTSFTGDYAATRQSSPIVLGKVALLIGVSSQPPGRPRKQAVWFAEK